MMSFLKALKSKLGVIKKYFRKQILRAFSLLYTKKNQRDVIFKLYRFIKKHDMKSANDYYFQSLNSLISLTKYQKLGYSDGLQRLIKTKKSDTVFILGSGPSINELSDNDWKHINNHDSWGFNFWHVHDFVPSHFIVQSTQNSIFDELMAELFFTRSKAYKDKKCAFFARGDNVNYFRFHKSHVAKAIIEESHPIHFLAEHFIYGGCTINPDDLIKKMYEIGCFTVRNNRNIPKFRSTVGFLISLALMAGYKKIILCGIDMNDNSHFFDGAEYLKKFPALDKLIHANKSMGETHPHIGVGIYSVTEYIISLNKLAKEKYSSEFMVSSKNSKLFPDVNLYKSD